MMKPDTRSYARACILTVGLFCFVSVFSACHLFEKPVTEPDLSRVNWGRFSSFALAQSEELSTSGISPSASGSFIIVRTLLGFDPVTSDSEVIELVSSNGDVWQVERIEKASEEMLILFLRSIKEHSAWFHVIVDRQTGNIYNLSATINAFFAASDFFVDEWADYTRDGSLVTIIHGRRAIIGPVYGHVLDIDLSTQTVRPVNNAKFDVVWDFYGSSSGHVAALVNSLDTVKYYPADGSAPILISDELFDGGVATRWWLRYRHGDILALPGSDIVFKFSPPELHRFTNEGVKVEPFDPTIACGLPQISFGRRVYTSRTTTSSNEIPLTSVGDTVLAYYDGQLGELTVLSTTNGELECAQYDVPGALSASSGMALVQDTFVFDRDSVGIFAVDLLSGQSYTVTTQPIIDWESAGDRVVYYAYETAVNIATFSTSIDGTQTTKLFDSKLSSVSIVVF